MTDEQLEAERQYRVLERLGIMAGDAEPTQDQKSIAQAEADLAVEQIRMEEELG